jgi:type IV pilus biogenesis protein PilP
MRITHLLVAGTIIIPSAAFADSLPTKDTGLSTAATTLLLTQLRNEYLVLQQENEIAILKAKIAIPGAPVPAGTGAPPDLPPYSAPTASPSLPTVVSLFGGRHITAILQLPSGAQVSAYPGEGLPDGMTVHDVSINGVQVMQAGNLITLPYADESQSSQGQASGETGGTPMLPGANIPMPMSVYPRAGQ